jgi:hypothetical protein
MVPHNVPPPFAIRGGGLIALPAFKMMQLSLEIAVAFFLQKSMSKSFTYAGLSGIHGSPYREEDVKI